MKISETNKYLIKRYELKRSESVSGKISAQEMFYSNQKELIIGDLKLDKETTADLIEFIQEVLF